LPQRLIVTSQIALTLAIFAIAIGLFLWDRWPVDIVATLCLLALTLSGLLTVPEALAGFGNSAVVSIGAIFVVSGAISRTGLADRMGNVFVRFGGASEARLVVVVMIGVCALSAFMYNAPATAVLLPAVMVTARRSGVSPSRLLIPLCSGALLGGTMTLIGAAPNLVVSQALETAGLPPFRVFDFLPMGMLISTGGILFMVLVGRRLLPDRDPVWGNGRAERPEELVALYNLRERWHRVRISDSSRLNNLSLTDACLSCEFGIIVLGLERAGRIYGTIRSDERLTAGDVLLLQGHDHDVAAAATDWGAEYLHDEQPAWALSDLAVAEATLAPRSNLEGKTIAEIQFRQRYSLEVLGIWRGDRAFRSHLAGVRLQIGDAILLQGPGRPLDQLRRDPDFLVLTGDVATGRRSSKGPLALAIIAVCLGLVILGVFSIAIGALLAAALMVVTGCLLPQEVYRDVDWRVLIMLGGTLALGAAMQKTGAAPWLAQNLIEPVASLGTVPLMAALFLTSSLLSIATSNVAAAVLMSPLALNVAARLHYQPRALLMIVLLGVSTAFVTPFAHQANLIVMGPGNYRFMDYVKVGALLSLLVFAITVVALPFVWPLV
jgi:di/tricarboxylate transporter